MAERVWCKRNQETVASNYSCSICGEIFRPYPQDEWSMDVDFARHRLCVHRNNRGEASHAALIVGEELEEI
jgi:hypothetical protein